MSRYDRQIALPRFGEAGQARLTRAHVLTIGAGGLGSHVLPLLAGAGVGRLSVIDGDRVALSNLHRQTLFSEADCGRPKAAVARRRLMALNSDIEVTAHDAVLTPANADAVLAGVDLVLDCADSFAVGHILSDACMRAGLPLISASVAGMAGYVGGFCGGAPSLRALFPDPPQTAESCAGSGVLGPAVALIGAAQAQMALALLLGLDPRVPGSLFSLDARTFHSARIRFDGAPEPASPLRFVARDELKDRDRIVDLRPAGAAIHPRAERLSPDAVRALPRLAPPPEGGRLVLCCDSGLTAWRTGAGIAGTSPGRIALLAVSAC